MGCWADQGRLYCSVSECHFGPQCVDDDEADLLRYHVWRTRGEDPRMFESAELERALGEIRDGKADAMPSHPAILCYCGAGKPRTRQMWTKRVEHRSCDVCRVWVSQDGRVVDIGLAAYNGSDRREVGQA